MSGMNTISICWLRRNLRLDDNAALFHALRENENVLVVFIFDTVILERLPDRVDKRIQFIHHQLSVLQTELKKHSSALLVKVGRPLDIWRAILQEWNVGAVYANHDYEPYSVQSDSEVGQLLKSHNIPFKTFKDHVIFEKEEVIKDNGLPYTVFTPYSRRWLAALTPLLYKTYETSEYWGRFLKTEAQFTLPDLKSLGFTSQPFRYPGKLIRADIISDYAEHRDFPAEMGTSRLGLHLRYGTLSIRKLLAYAVKMNQTFVKELIWRDFYHQILWHFPQVTSGAFRKEYDNIEWLNDEGLFVKWCEGKTGYPFVDAGMRELNETGFMHNRARMVTASFLTKHLLIDWRWGEVYFAEKLLDFDLAANNGGWQWAAGSGTDAAPYFRIFNPDTQMKKFDPQLIYVKKWVPEFGTPQYPAPIVEHKMARKRCLEVYRKALLKRI
jgi:deoxyribodipyrimidine photo-lyase